MPKKDILLINLGTPAHCDNASVRAYLKQFLNDPRVIDLPAVLRLPLVNGLIVPMRYKRTKAAYQQIWSAEGSPLLVYSQRLKEALSLALGSEYRVELGMRYGEPSIAAALERYQDSAALLVIPLFPQYASAATGSALQQVLQIIAKQWNIPALHLIRDFYNDAGFITAYAEIIKQHVAEKKIDFLLFSYHGLPERHIHKSHCHAVCNKINACPLVEMTNQYCYRAQCFATTRLIVKELGYAEHQYAVSFQSRLGRTPWIKPYTDLRLPQLAQQGIKNIAIVSPSFVVDCLETLEEINIRLRAQWMALGGDTFTFIPCLNDSALWVKALVRMIKENGW